MTTWNTTPPPVNTPALVILGDCRLCVAELTPYGWRDQSTGCVVDARAWTDLPPLPLVVA